jgi:hypothetical protein
MKLATISYPFGILEALGSQLERHLLAFVLGVGWNLREANEINSLGEYTSTMNSKVRSRFLLMIERTGTEQRST